MTAIVRSLDSDGQTMQSAREGFTLQWATPSSLSLKRPYTIERDVQRLQKSQVVTKALKSGTFKGELENVLQGMIGGRPNPSRNLALKKLQENVVPASKIEAAKQAQLPHGVTGGVYPSVIPINDLRGTSASKYSVAERQLRCKLASTYRLIEKMGWDELIYNHVTARIPGREEHFLLNPFGLHFSEITASSLVQVDPRGTIIDPGSTQLGISQAGYVIHSAIHQARKDVKCIIHIHTRAGAAVASMKCGLLPISQEAMTVGDVSYHDFRGIACDEEEREELAFDLGPVNMVMILRNHGLLALGRTVEEAFHFAYSLVYACEIQVSALVVGLSNLICVGKDVQQKVYEIGNRGGGGVSRHLALYGPGELEFEALMRTLDNQGYCTGYPYKAMHLLLPGPVDGGKDGSKPVGAAELRREGRRQRREKVKQILQKKLRELEEQERAELSSESQLSSPPPPAVMEAEAAMFNNTSKKLMPRSPYQVPAIPSHIKATTDSHTVPLVHHMTTPSQDNKTFPFPSFGKHSSGVSAVPDNPALTRRLEPRTNFVPHSGEKFPSGFKPTCNHDEDLPVNLGALLRVERTAQAVAASTSAAVEKLSHREQLEQTDLHRHAVYGLNCVQPDPLSSSASIPPQHQRQFFTPSLLGQGKWSGLGSSSKEEEDLDLGAVQRAQFIARRVAQSTGSAVEKLTQSLNSTLDDRPTNAT